MVKMVIVDDFFETSESLSLIYGSKGDVEIIGTARNSEQLWNILYEKEVDFVSLDIQLGRENGFEICKLLHEKYPDIFVVMCSVEATIENKRVAKEAGASHFLAKPIGMEDAADTLLRFSNRNRGVEVESSPLTDEKIDELFNKLL